MDNEILKNQIVLLPEKLRGYITTGNWQKIIQEICQKSNFSKERSLSLENETLFVLLGMELMSNFAKNLEQELLIPDLLAKTIAEETRVRIFAEIQEFLPTESQVPKEESAPQQKPQQEEKLLPESDHLIGNLPGSIPVSDPIPQKEPEKKWWQEDQIVTNTVPKVLEPMTPMNTGNNATTSTPQNTTQGQQLVGPQAKPPLDILHSQAGTTPFEQKLSNQANGAGENKIIQKTYQGQDPYREPIS